MSLKVTGTDLYTIDPDDGTLLEVGCVTSIDGIDAAVAAITISCINRRSDQKIAGNITPGKASFGINFDPSDDAHIRLHELKTAGVDLKWAIGLSDGPRDAQGDSTAPPTVDSSNDFDLPTTRSYVTFPGFMSSFPLSFSGGGAVVSSTIGIELSDDFVIVPKV